MGDEAMVRCLRPASGLILGLLSGCGAAAVLTHSVDVDPVDAPAGTYALSPRHSDLLFDVSHFDYSHYHARFDEVDAELTFDPAEPANSSVTATIAAASVSTGDGEIDRLLKGPGFFDAARYPDITFRSTRITVTGPTTGQIEGDLTIHDSTHRVTLDVTFNGGAPNPLEPFHVLGFSARGQFSRSEFGLADWFPAIGDEVDVLVEAEFQQPL
jgi:polyisoprenoid-binding protein YceI